MKAASRSLPDFLRNDWVLTLAFFALGVLTRLPFYSQLLYHWDSVNFALGMEHFDVRLHQPHPPGYLLYVLMGRVFEWFTHDASASLVAISILFSGLTVAVVYRFTRRLFGPTEAVIAALFTLTSPAVWFYGEVALTYILESFFVTVIALACLAALRGERWMVYAAAILLGLAGGIRQTTLILMLPLLAFVLLRYGWRERILGAAVLGITVLAWLVPTIWLSGGLEAYLEASRSIGGGVLTDFELLDSEASLLVRLSPLWRLGAYLGYGLALALIPLLYGTWRLLRNIRDWRAWLRNDRFQVLGLWLAPNLIVYAPLVRAPGHTFSFITALLILAAGVLVAWGRGSASGVSNPRRAWGLAGAAIILLVNIIFFVAAPPYLFDIHRVITTTTSAATVHYRDIYIAERVDYILHKFDPASTLVLTSGPDFRHPAYYLRAYKSLAQSETVPEGITTVVFFTGDLTSPAAQQATLPSGEAIRWLVVKPGQQITLNDTEVTLSP